MDLGTKIVVLIAAVVGLITAVIAYRTAKLKHDTEAQRPISERPAKKEPGPFDDMFSIMGAFGAMLGPMLMIGIVYIVLTAGTRLLSLNTHGAQSADDKAVVADVRREALNPLETKLYDLTETADGMSPGVGRDDALRHVVDLAIKQSEYSSALRAATRMSPGVSRDDALISVAMAAARNYDPVTADKTIRQMSPGIARDEAAQKIMSVLEKQETNTRSPTHSKN